MKSKILSTVLVAVLLIPLLSVQVFAADLTNEDVVDAQGGFFRDIGNLFTDGFNKSIANVKSGIAYISDGIGKIISTIVNTTKDAVNAIGGFFTKVISAIGKAIRELIKAIYDLFVPRDDYFPRIQSRLQTAINGKLGGVLSVTEYFKTRFAGLNSNPNADSMMVAQFPSGHMFSGARIDFIARIRPAIPIFRDVFSALMIIATVLFCYRHIKEMVNT